MTPIMEIYQNERVRLENELEGLRDSKAAVDSLCASLERMRLKYREHAKDAADRAEADRLFDVARQSAKCMLSVSGVGMKVLKDEPHTPTPVDRFAACLPMAGMLIGAVLTAWLLIKDMYTPAVLSTALTAVGWLEAQVIYRRRIAVAAVTKVNGNELLRLLDRMMEALEDALDQAFQQRKPLLSGTAVSLAAGQSGMLTGEMLEPMQMLLEAGCTQDGEYALKALPKLSDALLRQGIEAVDYSPETAAYFEMYPSDEGGRTIRPALVKDGTLIARGQATERME